METKVTYQPIGIVHTPFNDIAGMPIQPHGAPSIDGLIELDPELLPGLTDIEGFSHLILIYHLHQVKGAQAICGAVYGRQAPWHLRHTRSG